MGEKIGEFLVRIGTMTAPQVKQVLAAQNTGYHRRFGEIALELGFIHDDAIKRYVDYLEQQNIQDE
jgi:K+ transporter